MSYSIIIGVWISTVDWSSAKLLGSSWSTYSHLPVPCRQNSNFWGSLQSFVINILLLYVPWQSGSTYMWLWSLVFMSISSSILLLTHFKEVSRPYHSNTFHVCLKRLTALASCKLHCEWFTVLYWLYSISCKCWLPWQCHRLPVGEKKDQGANR